MKNAILQSNTNPGKENHFRVFTPQDSRTYFFQAISQEEKLNWIKCLSAAVSEVSEVAEDDNDHSNLNLNFSTHGSLNISLNGIQLSPRDELSAELPILSHLEKFKEPVLVVDQKKIIVGVNSNSCKFFGVEDQNCLIGESMEFLFLDTSKLKGSKNSFRLKAKKIDKGENFDSLITVTPMQKGYQMLQISESHPQSQVLTSRLFSRSQSNFF